MMALNNFKWWYAIIGYVAYLLALIASSTGLPLVEGFLEGVRLDMGAFFNVIMFVFAGIFCLLLLRLVSRNALSAADFGIHTTGIVRAMVIGSALGICFFGLTSWIESNNAALREAGTQVTESFDLGSHCSRDLLLLLNTCLFAPVAEEIVFRGAIFNSIVQGLNRYPRIPHCLVLVAALIISGYAFMSAHGGGGQDEQIWLIALLSLFAALAMYLTKSLFGAIFVHAVNNVLTITQMIYHAPELESAYRSSLIAAALFCVILCLPLGLLFGRILRSEPQ